MSDPLPLEYKHAGYTISTDKARLDIPGIHAFLRESYWASGIPRDVVARSIENALCFGVYEGVRQIGFGRVISDFATFAYLSDVFILAPHRGKGLAEWLLACIRSHPDLQGLRRWMLATRDAHGLYARVVLPSSANRKSLWSWPTQTYTGHKGRSASEARDREWPLDQREGTIWSL